MALTYEPIAAVTISSTGSSVTFSSIPATYTDLILVSQARRGIDGSGGDGLKSQFNGDTSSNYSTTQLYAISSAASARSTNSTLIGLGIAADGRFVANIANIQNYSNTTTYKTILVRNNDTGDQAISANVSLWRSTAAINSIYITAASGFYAGSTFTLYGVKNA